MKIAAFNVKKLGLKKVTDKTVMQYLTKIISQYSVIVILEVVDKSGKAMEKLHQELNKTSCNRKRPYCMVASMQLGRDTYKEQFVCFYRRLFSAGPQSVCLLRSSAHLIIKMKIAAFNVKNLGTSKVNDDVVRKNLIRIVSRYSVVVLLEVMDGNGWAMKKFHTELNQYNKRDPYQIVKSRLLGRSTYKERFVFFFRESEVKLMDNYQYEEEEDEDVFSREPFVVRFRCYNTVLKDLVLIPVHSKPEDAQTELEALDNVVTAVRKRWKTTNIMILGDFNASGRYLPQRKRKNSPMFHPPYYWLIGDDVDTTTSNANDFTYDRIVVYGHEMNDAVVPGSAKAFDFQTAYNLSDSTTQDISDHYPVEVELWQS